MIDIFQRQSVQGDLQIPMQKAQGKVARVYNAKGLPLMISSRRDGEHSPGSLHYIGMAEDYLDPIPHKVSKAALEAELGPDFDVVEYDWGYHIEYDP